MKRFLLPICLLLCCGLLHAQARVDFVEGPDIPQPDRTLLFAQRDTCELLLDYYAAAPGAGPCADAQRKPVIIHIFGGAFVMGQRNYPGDRVWYRQLADAGYHVVAIDYRLALKGKVVKSRLSLPPVLSEAIGAAVEDLFSATGYLIDHAAELGIDPDRIILSGSSAGAITALQAEWEIINGKESAQVLPRWFNYAGVMAFAGAVFTMEGPITFPQKPCPILMFYGTEDHIVPFGKISVLRNQFAGSAALAEKLKPTGANFQIYRFQGAGHEIATSMLRNVPEELRFLEENVIKGIYRPLDATLTDPTITKPEWSHLSTRDLYKQ